MGFMMMLYGFEWILMWFYVNVIWIYDDLQGMKWGMDVGLCGVWPAKLWIWIRLYMDLREFIIGCLIFFVGHWWWLWLLNIWGVMETNQVFGWRFMVTVSDCDPVEWLLEDLCDGFSSVSLEKWWGFRFIWCALIFPHCRTLHIL